jgi:hypothetical protein
LSWLDNSESVPEESIQGLISDRGLVARLGDLYEYRLRRLIYNGELFDTTAETMGAQLIPEIWDFQRHELLTSDYEKIAAFRGRVRWANGWARWYLGSLADYNKALSQLIVDVEKYLQEHGGTAGVDDLSP